MESKTSYLYKLGHIQPLSLAEVEANYQGSYTLRKDSLLELEADLDIQKFGSLVFKAIKVSAFPTSLSKKIGIIGSKSKAFKLIQEAKSKGAKKVNFIASLKAFNIGHWKQTQAWFYQDKRGCLYQILDYFDQEFWARLDKSLPFSEMDRGLINLKLARSLLNLTKNKTVWDPMVGVGRLVVAGLDLKSNFYLSDKDDLAISNKKNLALAQDFFTASKKPIARVEDFWQLDLARFNQDNLETSFARDLPSVVTEGWLGQNFQTTPNLQNLKQEWGKVFQTWSLALQNLAKLKVPEVIFCLPFYRLNGKKILPQSELAGLISKSDYRIEKLAGRDYILYYREKTITGHLIIKLTLL